MTRTRSKDYVNGFEHGMFWMVEMIKVNLEEILIKRKEVLKNLRKGR